MRAVLPVNTLLRGAVRCGMDAKRRKTRIRRKLSFLASLISPRHATDADQLSYKAAVCLSPASVCCDADGEGPVTGGGTVAE